MSTGDELTAQPAIERTFSGAPKAAAELDRLLAAKSIDVEEVAAEFKAARKAGAAHRRKTTGRSKAA